MKLGKGDEMLLRRFVGNIHISKTDEEVEQIMRNKIGGDSVPSEMIEEAVQFAVEVHHANQGLYNKVMSGQI